MSQAIVLSTLSALSDDATLKALASIASAEINTHRSSRRSRSNDLLSSIKDAETQWSGTSAPEAVTGKVWYDTTNGYAKVYNGSTWVQLLDSAKGYLADLSTAGTATFRLGGPIKVVTTQVQQTGSNTGALMTYTLPAGTLARAGQYLHIVGVGTSAAGQTFSVQIRFGASPTAIATFAGISTITTWVIEAWITRVTATTQKAGAYIVWNRDDTGKTDLCAYIAPAETLANALTLDFNVSAKGGSVVISQEKMIVEYASPS